MSTFEAETPTDEYLPSPCDGISAIIQAREKPLDSFSVRRFLPHSECRKVGPFVFFDHMGPADFKPGQGMDVRPHPHIGLATVTYMFEGEMLHRDSLGHVQAITPGAVNWMIAGKGIVHSERTGDGPRARGQRMHGLQVWVALPEEHEETEPGFFHYGSDELPEIRQDDVIMKLVAGTAFSHKSPVKVFSPMFYLDVRMPASSTVEVPQEFAERAIHVISGEVQISDRVVSAYSMAICRESARVEITALQDTRLMMFGGAAIGDRIVWWNFVSSSKQRLEQAKLDWKEDRFGKVPGETEFIPLPDKR
ncbi:MAG: pirin family protein [Gammaproteobacteria bacterium]